MTLALRGIFAPVITPFRGTAEDLDVPGFQANLRAHVDSALEEGRAASASKRAELEQQAGIRPT